MNQINKRLMLVEIGQIIQAVAILVILLLLLNGCAESNPLSDSFLGKRILAPFENDCQIGEVVAVEESKYFCTYTLSDGTKRTYNSCALQVGDAIAIGCGE